MPEELDLPRSSGADAYQCGSGHESAGEVVEVGEGVTQWKVGMLDVSSMQYLSMSPFLNPISVEFSKVIALRLKLVFPVRSRPVTLAVRAVIMLARMLSSFPRLPIMVSAAHSYSIFYFRKTIISFIPNQ